jgi:hypothetical protein
MKTAPVRKLSVRARETAKLPFPNQPRMLRHSTRYKLANDGARYARDPAVPRPPQHHAHLRYTELSPERFKNAARYRIRKSSPHLSGWQALQNGALLNVAEAKDFRIRLAWRRKEPAVRVLPHQR